MSDTIDIQKRNFNGVDALLKYLNGVNEENIITISKSDIEDCFGKDVQLVCFSSKSTISIEKAQEALLGHIGDRLNSSSGVAIVYHTPMDYSLMKLSYLLNKIEVIMDEDKCMMFATYQNETIFGVEFILNFSSFC